MLPQGFAVYAKKSTKIYAGASTKSAVRGTLRKEACAAYLQRSGDFALVQYGDVSGYVRRDDLVKDAAYFYLSHPAIKGLSKEYVSAVRVYEPGSSAVNPDYAPMRLFLGAGIADSVLFDREEIVMVDCNWDDGEDITFLRLILYVCKDEDAAATRRKEIETIQNSENNLILYQYQNTIVCWSRYAQELSASRAVRADKKVIAWLKKNAIPAKGWG